MAVSKVRSQVEVSISSRMKSFLTDLLVQLAVLSLCVNSSKLYFLHMKRLLIFVITTSNVCFCIAEGYKRNLRVRPQVLVQVRI